jgi:hypothetical protein
MQGAKPDDTFELQKKGDKWHKFPISDIQFSDAGFDVCAFSSNLFQVGGDTSEYTGQTIFPGDMVKFVGYPHELSNTFENAEFTTPLVRTAYFSGIPIIDGRQTIILDGFNNPGYSGSPIYYRDSSRRAFGILGSISGYRNELATHSRVYTNQNGFEQPVDGVYTKPNSGMIIAVGRSEFDQLALRLKLFNPRISGNSATSTLG